MPKLMKVSPPTQKQQGLEEQYIQVFGVDKTGLVWLPFPDSMSLEQPSPFAVVPSITTYSVYEDEAWMDET